MFTAGHFYFLITQAVATVTSNIFLFSFSMLRLRYVVLFAKFDLFSVLLVLAFTEIISTVGYVALY